MMDSLRSNPRGAIVTDRGTNARFPGTESHRRMARPCRNEDGAEITNDLRPVSSVAPCDPGSSRGAQPMALKREM